MKIAIIVLILLLAGLYLARGPLVRRMIYPRPWLSLPDQPPEPLQGIRLPLAPETEVPAWLFLESNENRLVIFFHGNGENLRTMSRGGLFGDLGGLGVNFLAVEYPGYAPDSGDPAEEKLIATGVAGVEWARKNLPGQSLVLCGWSLGAAVAVQTAARVEGQIDGLILLSPWSTLPDVAAAHYPGWLVRALLPERYDSRAAAKQVRVPTLLIHGAADRIIPASHSAALQAAFPQPPRRVEIPGAGHNDLLAHPQTWQLMKEFLDSI